MIILTEEEAAKVRGISPNNSGAALNPVPLKDGTYYLGEEVLSDPAHADVRTFLEARIKALDKTKQYVEGDALPAEKTFDVKTMSVRKEDASIKAEIKR